MNAQNIIVLLGMLLGLALIVSFMTEELAKAYIDKFDIVSDWVKHVLTIVLNAFLVYYVAYCNGDYRDWQSLLLLFLLAVAGAEVIYSIKGRLKQADEYVGIQAGIQAYGGQSILDDDNGGVG